MLGRTSAVEKGKGCGEYRGNPLMRVGGLHQQTCSWPVGFSGTVVGLAAARLAKRRGAKSASYLRAHPTNRPENYVLRFESWGNRGLGCISPIHLVSAKTRLDSERRWI